MTHNHRFLDSFLFNIIILLVFIGLGLAENRNIPPVGLALGNTPWKFKRQNFMVNQSFSNFPPWIWRVFQGHAPK